MSRPALKIWRLAKKLKNRSIYRMMKTQTEKKFTVSNWAINGNEKKRFYQQEKSCKGKQEINLYTLQSHLQAPQKSSRQSLASNHEECDDKRCNFPQYR